MEIESLFVRGRFFLKGLWSDGETALFRDLNHTPIVDRPEVTDLRKCRLSLAQEYDVRFKLETDPNLNTLFSTCLNSPLIRMGYKVSFFFLRGPSATLIFEWANSEMGKDFKPLGAHFQKKTSQRPP